MTESNWHHATAELVCKKCGAMNLPGSLAKPTIEQEQDGTYTCSMCGCNFPHTSWAYRMTQHQLEDDKKDE